MEKQKTTKGSVIAYWICAGAWLFTLLIDLVCDANTVILVTHAICAVVWAICAILITRKYRKEKEACNDEE